MKRADRIRDELLVLRAQAGADGLDALVTRWQPALWRHAYRMTRNAQDASDVAQDAWVAIVRRLDRLEDPAAFPGWAFQIVTNKCRDWARKETRRKRTVAAYKSEVPTQRDPPRQADDRLGRALGELNDELRQLVALYYEEEFSVREVSEIVGLKVGTVKSRLHRARQELRCYLEDIER